MLRNISVSPMQHEKMKPPLVPKSGMTMQFAGPMTCYWNSSMSISGESMEELAYNFPRSLFLTTPTNKAII